MKTTRTARLAAIFAFALGCDEGGMPPLATVDITFVFPSPQQQAESANAHAWILAPRDGTGSCEALVEGDLDPFDTSFIVLDDVAVIGDALEMAVAHAPAGPVIVYGETADFRGNIYLAGCTTAEIILPNTAVSIDLRPVGIVECDTPGVIDGAMCDDGDICTIGDSCMGGTCSGGTPRDCTALTDDCNLGICMAGLGCVRENAPPGASCDDGIACSTGEVCNAGSCGGGDYSGCCPGPDCREFDCANGMDEDGDFDVDCDDLDCDADPVCVPPENCTNFFDDDRDGLTDCGDPDCAALVVCAGCVPGSCPDANLGNAVRLDLATGNTASSCHRVDATCGDATLADDVSYAWQAPRAGTYRFQTNSAIFDHALEVLSGCGGTSLGCDTGFVSTFVDVDLTAGQRVVVLIDGIFADSGTYILGVSERLSTEAGLCDDFLDNDDDLLTDCEDTDCAADPLCIEQCSGGTDEDGDLRIDCLDTDCLGDPECGEAGFCGDLIGNDSDTAIDCTDSECTCAPECFGGSCPERVTLGAPLSLTGLTTVSRCNNLTPECEPTSQAADYAIPWGGPGTLAGDYVFATTAATFDSVIYVLDATTCDGTATSLGCNDTVASNNASVTVTLAADATVLVVVDGVDVGQGSFNFTATRL